MRFARRFGRAEAPAQPFAQPAQRRVRHHRTTVAEPQDGPASTGAGTHRTRWTKRVLFCIGLLYLLPGLLGHDPWKQDETYTFGIIDHFLRTHRWLIPVNAGQPFMEKPPLYMWTASVLAWAFEPWLPLHDGARLASLVFGALALFGTARAAQASFSATRLADGRVIGTLALFAGSLLVVKHVHDMFSDVALMAGTALGVASLIRIVMPLATPTGTATASGTFTSCSGRVGKTLDILGLGFGVGIAMMSKGVFIPGVFFLTVLLLPVWIPACRNRRYVGAIVMAMAASLPFLLIWPIWLYHASPALFMTWFWDNNVGRFLGFSVAELGSDNERGFVFKAIFTTGFPVGPLACLGVIVGARHLLRRPAQVIALSFCVIGIGALSTSATARQLYILPFILPMALLAADGLIHLPPRAAQRLVKTWDYFSRVLFGLLLMAAWIIWFIMRQPAAQTGWIEKHHVLGFAGRWLPLDYSLAFHPIETIVATLLSVIWVCTLACLHRLGRWRGPVSWFAGVSVVWGVVFTLLLPWINVAKSYGPVFQDLGRAVSNDWLSEDCMASLNLGESEQPMLYYFANILPRPIERDAAGNGVGKPSQDGAACHWLIDMGPPAQRVSDPRWKPFWEGHRQGEPNVVFRVYERR